MGLLCPLCSLAFDWADVAIIAFAGMFVVGLVLQTAAGLRAWRSGLSGARAVTRSTLLYWAAASAGAVAGWVIAFWSFFASDPLAPDPPVRVLIELSLAGLPVLWLVAAVCGAVVIGVISAARAVAARPAVR